MKMYHFKVYCAFKHGSKYMENINSLAGREEVSIQHNQRPLYLQGPLGDSGADGRSGLKGPRGYRGSVGPTGDRGEEGETVSDDRQLVGYYCDICIRCTINCRLAGTSLLRTFHYYEQELKSRRIRITESNSRFYGLSVL